MSMDSHTEKNLAIFCAALQGYVANPNFYPTVSNPDAEAAVAFARMCVREAHNNKPEAPDPVLA